MTAGCSWRGARGRPVGPAARCGQRASSVRKPHRRRPIRVRRDSPRAERRSRWPTLISVQRTANPGERGIGRYAPEVRFSPRPAEAPQGRCAFGASDPLTQTGQCPNANFQTQRSSRRATQLSLRLDVRHRQNLSTPSSLLKSRSNVPRGRCPAFRATSRTRQSEKPNAGRLRKLAAAAATASES